MERQSHRHNVHYDVLHVTPRLGRAGGGVWQFVHDLARAQANAGLRVALAGLDGPHVAADAAVLRADQRIDVYPARPAFNRFQGALWTLGYSPDLGRHICDLAGRSRLIHAHGGPRMWTLTAVRRAQDRHQKRVLLATHGSMYPWLLNRNRLRKAALGVLLDWRNLASADAIHVTCDQELQFCRDAGLTQPAEVIPPGVTPLPPGVAERWRAKHPDLDGKRLATFLGYFDRKKGLLRLVRAWADLGDAAKNWILVIAGHDQLGHAAEVQAEVQRLGLGTSVRILGPYHGDEKHDLLAATSLLVLPTDWENFGVVVGEALSVGVPVLTTTNTPWQWLAQKQAGWWVAPTQEAIETALAEAIASMPGKLGSMGRAGQAQVLTQYGWSDAVERLEAMYEWMAGRADPPADLRMA